MNRRLKIKSSGTKKRKDVSIVEIDVRDEWVGKNLIERNLRKKHGFNIAAIKKSGPVSVNINPEQVLDGETGKTEIKTAG